MVIADILENFRAANRRVANVIACEVAAAAETAERDRQKAAVVVNALNATRTRQLSKPTGIIDFAVRSFPGLISCDSGLFQQIGVQRKTADACSTTPAATEDENERGTNPLAVITDRVNSPSQVIWLTSWRTV
jgi:hypothetical protein